MTERKNIDRLFQEKFKDFEALPPEQVWEKIEAELKEKKDKRKVIPFWFRLGGIAAALLIGLFISIQFIDGNNLNVDVVNGTENSGIRTDKNFNTSETPVNQQKPKFSSSAIENNNMTVTQADDDKKLTPGIDLKQYANPGKSVSPVSSASTKQFNSANVNSSAATVDLQTKVASHRQNSPPANRPIFSKNNTALVKNEKPSTLISTQARNEKSIAAAAIHSKRHSNKALKDKFISDTAPNENNNNTVAVTKSENNSNGFQTTETKSTLVDSLLNAKAIASENIDKKTDTTATPAVPNALEELLKEKEKKEVVTTEPKVNRWQITSNVAPIYFSSTSNGSPLDSRFQANNKSYKPSISYGAGLQYAVNKKLAIRTGVNTVDMEYTTNDVVFFQTPNARKLENLKSNIQGSLLQIDNKPTELSASFGRAESKFDGLLNQRTSYVEVPVELSYTLLNHKLGVELIGGISTLILNANEVSLISPGLGINIGEADNLNRIHFSTNVGVGIKYDFLKSFRINFEPMFKYQVNTFSNNAGNFKPYFFGLYTGLSFRF